MHEHLKAEYKQQDGEGKRSPQRKPQQTTRTHIGDHQNQSRNPQKQQKPTIDITHTHTIPSLPCPLKSFNGADGAGRLIEGVQYVLKLSFEKQLDKKPTAKSLALLPLSHIEDMTTRFPEWRDYLRDWIESQPAHLVPGHLRGFF